MDARRDRQRVTSSPPAHPPAPTVRRLTLAVVALAVALVASLTVGTLAYVQGRADTEAIIDLIGGRSALRDLENNTLRQQIDDAVCDALLPWPSDDPTAAAVREERACLDPTIATPAPPAASSDSAPQPQAESAPSSSSTGIPGAPVEPGTGPDPPVAATEQGQAATTPVRPATPPTTAPQPTPGPITPTPTPAPPTAPTPDDRGLLCELLPLDLVCDL